MGKRYELLERQHGPRTSYDIIVTVSYRNMVWSVYAANLTKYDAEVLVGLLNANQERIEAQQSMASLADEITKTISEENKEE